jgi:hypothetical protein
MKWMHVMLSLNVYIMKLQQASRYIHKNVIVWSIIHELVCVPRPLKRCSHE